MKDEIRHYWYGVLSSIVFLGIILLFCLISTRLYFEIDNSENSDLVQKYEDYQTEMRIRNEVLKDMINQQAELSQTTRDLQKCSDELSFAKEKYPMMSDTYRNYSTTEWYAHFRQQVYDE